MLIFVYLTDYFLASCPEGYFKLPMGSSRSCFSVHNTTVSWDDALLGCALDNGTLASIDSREEADLIVGLLTSKRIRNTWLLRPKTAMVKYSKSVLLQQNTTQNAICIGSCKFR